MCKVEFLGISPWFVKVHGTGDITGLIFKMLKKINFEIKMVQSEPCTCLTVWKYFNLMKQLLGMISQSSSWLLGG
jgi:hypothetical protein